MAMKKITFFDGMKLEYNNGELTVNGIKYSEKYVSLQAEKSKGISRIRKPAALLFWIDCKNNNNLKSWA